MTDIIIVLVVMVSLMAGFGLGYFMGSLNASKYKPSDKDY